MVAQKHLANNLGCPNTTYEPFWVEGHRSIEATTLPERIFGGGKPTVWYSGFGAIHITMMISYPVSCVQIFRRLMTSFFQSKHCGLPGLADQVMFAVHCFFPCLSMFKPF